MHVQRDFDATDPCPDIVASPPHLSRRSRSDPPLIAEIKKPLPFEALPRFTPLLDAMGGPLDFIRDAAGRTALHWSAHGGDEEPALLLLRHGNSPNAPDDKGRTPLFDAIERSDK